MFAVKDFERVESPDVCRGDECWAVQGWTRRRKTTVAQTLMRGLVTAGPVFVLGLPLSQARG